MSHSPSPVSLDDAQTICEARPFQVSGGLRTLLYLCLVIGGLAFFFKFSGDKRSALVSLQVNFIYWFLVSAAASCFAAVFQICNAQWSRPLRRIFESASVFLLYSVIPLVVLYFFSGELFQWVHEQPPGKGNWLTPNFVYTRDIIAILLLCYLVKKLIGLSLSRDIGAIRGGLVSVSKDAKSRWNAPMYDKYVRNWGSNTKEAIAETTSSMGRLSPVIIIVYSLVMSLIAFDQIMSVDYHWYSTLYGVLYFMGGAYLTFAWVGISVPFLRSFHPLFRKKIERRTLHDAGKLLFGFGIFWAYMFWSHYLPMWYGNIPEETGWVILRLREQPWHSLAWGILGSCFFVPFLLGLSRDVKQVPILLCLTGVIVAIGLWLQQYILFAPTLYPDTIPLGLADIGIYVGFMSVFILCCLSYLEKVPLMPFGDLYATE